jgi:hypothetical protein
MLDVTNIICVLKFDTTPGADESYQHLEAGLSQKVCMILSETALSLVVKAWEVLVSICRVL